MTEHTHIVVVNDSPEFLAVMADLLHDHHYAATVIDGDRDEAVDLVRAAEPDGLIIDLRLGRDGLHGWDVLQQIRRDPELKELPTVICSADIEALGSLQGDVSGMRRVSTLKKPFSIDQLLASLRQVLELEPA
ncbi:MAG TPA: response regulator [Candidatus Limnocylindria bacterium]|nr:response regulator [Candidatus Limnocylindria bacterium]